MRYTKPLCYLNDVLLEYQKETIIDDKTTQERVEELIPFLSGKKYPDRKKSTKDKTEAVAAPSETENKDNPQDEISDDEFFSLTKVE